MAERFAQMVIHKPLTTWKRSLAMASQCIAEAGQPRCYKRDRFTGLARQVIICGTVMPDTSALIARSALGGSRFSLTASAAWKGSARR